MELSKLAEKDPEFYKYLQENDRELLEFSLNDANAAVDEDGDEDAEAMEEDTTPVLTKEILQRWQKALLDVRSVYWLTTAYSDIWLSSASVTQSASQDAHRIPVGSTHE